VLAFTVALASVLTVGAFTEKDADSAPRLVLALAEILGASALKVASRTLALYVALPPAATPGDISEKLAVSTGALNVTLADMLGACALKVAS
jgi:hypothetical protein